MKPLNDFFARRFWFFITALSAASLLTFLLTVFYQVNTVRDVLNEKILNTAQLHQNEFLNEIARQDWESVQEHVAVLQSQLGVDSVSLRVGEREFISEAKFAGEEAKSRFSNLIFQRPVRFEFSNDFGRFAAVLDFKIGQLLWLDVVAPILRYSVFIFCSILLIGVLIFWKTLRDLDRVLVRPLSAICDAFRDNSRDVSGQLTVGNVSIKEIQELVSACNEQIKMRSEAATFEKQKALTRLAIQVAHDVRSPLSALKVLMLRNENPKEMKDMSILKAVIDRIEGISNDLVLRYKNEKGLRLKSREFTETRFLVFRALEDIVNEKKRQYSSDHDLKIILDLEENLARSAFSSAPLSDFKRVISNLVDNAVAATSCAGIVRLCLSVMDGEIRVSISDNGVGVDPALLSSPEKLGLGLSDALEKLSEWGGRLTLDKTDSGAIVTLQLPQCSPPGWFADRLDFSFEYVVILDDDPSVHQFWRSRLCEELGFLNEKIISCYNLDDIERVLARDFSATFLIDYQLGSSRNGLDLIVKHKLFDSSVIVSSMDESFLVGELKRFGVKLLPKSFATHVLIARNAQMTTGSVGQSGVESSPNLDSRGSIQPSL